MSQIKTIKTIGNRSKIRYIHNVIVANNMIELIRILKQEINSGGKVKDFLATKACFIVENYKESDPVILYKINKKVISIRYQHLTDLPCLPPFENWGSLALTDWIIDNPEFERIMALKVFT